MTGRIRGAAALVVVGLVAACSGSAARSSGTSSSTSTPAATPPVTKAASFHTDGSRIIGPGTAQFVPVGANMLGPDSFWPTPTQGRAASAARWGWNTIRLITCLPGGCDGTGKDGAANIDQHVNDDLDAIVSEYTSQHIVVMVSMAEVKPGLWPTDDQLEAMRSWWVGIATRYAHNPYVWFNVISEPGSDVPASPKWLDVNATLIDAIRGTGADNIVVVDGTQWGQEAHTFDLAPVPAQNSAILMFGSDLVRGRSNIVFDLHAYDEYGASDGSDADRDTRLAGIIDRIRAAGFPLLIGEAGGPADDPFSVAVLGAEAAFRVAPPRGVGILAWHATPGDGYALTTAGDFDAIDSYTAPTNLTPVGEALWALSSANRH